MEDDLLEVAETVSLVLSNPTPGVQLWQAAATLTLLDNETGPGGVDAGFNPGLGGDNFVRGLALQPDGRVLVAGGFTQWDGTNRAHVARLHPDGSHDLSFDPGAGANALVAALGRLADGRIVAGGAFSNFNHQPFNRLVRLQPNGALDLNLDEPPGFDAAVNALALQADGRVVVGGGFSLPAPGLTRLRLDGSVDPTFALGAGADGPVHVLSVLPDGRILAGGAFTTIDHVYRSRVALLGGSGVLDAAFVPADIQDGAVYALAVQRDGCVLIGGDFTRVGGEPRQGIARLLPGGALDRGFDPGLGVSNAVFAIGLQSSGKILIGGDFTSVNGTHRNRYARLHATGALDLDFDPGSGANGAVYALVVLPNDDLILGGNFTEIDGEPRSGVARISGADREVRIVGIAVSNRLAYVTIRAMPGLSYVLEASTGVSGWMPVASGTARSSSLTFPGVAMTGFPSRFFRVVLPPL
jgi:uncharacterized delta-60 repeat protein